jgi:hypothetical protein
MRRAKASRLSRDEDYNDVERRTIEGCRRRSRMKERRPRKVAAQLFAGVTIYLGALSGAHSQAIPVAKEDSVHRIEPSGTSICEATAVPPPLKDALRQVCLRKRGAMSDATVRRAIIIGFVGGFVRRDDANHPEVQFAAYLRERYPTGVHAEVFANHEGQEAQRYVLSLLDTDGDGVLTAAEKEQANVIIYGHSWGASQTVTLARELGRHGIPVLLTIQVDSIAKPGQKDSTISPNVARAINFYQPRGLLHGRTTIVAADPARTKILGNVRMTYRDRRINCDNYQWFVRVFNKPHHEIENDPRVWDQAAALIDSELSTARSTIQASTLK